MHARGEHADSAQKVPAWDSNKEPSGCEAKNCTSINYTCFLCLGLSEKMVQCCCLKYSPLVVQIVHVVSLCEETTAHLVEQSVAADRRG